MYNQYFKTSFFLCLIKQKILHFFRISVDADYFKKINDQFGHDLGDQALRVIASLLTKTAEGAKPFRYGGEEFCLLFKSKSKQEVLQTLEQIRLAIANYDMVVRNKKQRPKKPQQGE